MKQDSSISRYKLLWIVISCYLLPVICLSVYSTMSDRWSVMSLGLLLAACGSLLIFFMMTRLEINTHSFAQTPQKITSTITPEEPLATVQISHQEELLAPAYTKELEEAQQLNSQQKETIEELRTEIETFNAKLQQYSSDKDNAAAQNHKILEELEDYRLTSCQQLEQQQAQILELQQTIAEQKAFIDKKQQQTSHLESKVGDLTYEIKTLLQLAEAHSGSLYNEPPPSSAFMPEFQYDDSPSIMPERQIRSSEEATLQLKRCLDIAQKITGSQRFNSQLNAFRDSAADSFALDLRRLCDSLRSENNSTILLYSPKDNQLLFANNQIKTLTGWSPDKFVQNFADILQNENAWRQGITSLAMRSEAQFKIPLKNKSGHDILAEVHMGMIPTGIFRHHTIAVLFQLPTSPF